MDGGRRGHDPLDPGWIGGGSVAMIHRFPMAIAAAFPLGIVCGSGVWIFPGEDEFSLPEIAVYVVRWGSGEEGEAQKDRGS